MTTKIVDLYFLDLQNGYDSDELVRDLQSRSPAAVILNFADSTIFCVVLEFYFGEELLVDLKGLNFLTFLNEIIVR